MNRLTFQCQHRYPGGFVLDATFALGDGITGLFGPSGSGKSTILSIITGALRPDHGDVQLSGKTLVNTQTRTCLAANQRHVGVVFQDPLLFPHLSVEANLRYGARRHPSRQIDFSRLVQLLELTDLLGRSPATLSGGQKQRTALGRAILSGPQLLLLDEPFTGLDTPLKDRILAYLERALSEWSIPTLLVSHDQTDVRRLADFAVILDAGKVVASGPAIATLDRATMTGLKGHPGPINLLRLEDIRRASHHWEGRLGEQWLHLPGEAPIGWTGVVQFLPRDITLSRGDTGDLSTRNRITGTVKEVVLVDGRAFVSVDAGKMLWAEVTPESASDLNIAAGAIVSCLIKASAIQQVG